MAKYLQVRPSVAARPPVPQQHARHEAENKKYDF